MKKRLEPTQFDTLERHFSDLVRKITSGHPSGSPDKWPRVRKTIHFHDGTTMTVMEHIDKKTGAIKTYQYDWEYAKDRFVKWHNEPHDHKSHQTITEPHHIHFEGMLLTDKERSPNFGHHDLTTILESIRIRNRTFPPASSPPPYH